MLAGIDDEFSRLGVLIPGFGGFFFDRLGNLNVYLTQSSQREAAVNVLTEFFANHQVSIATRRQPDVAALRVLKAEFEWLQLQAWAHAILDRSEGIAGFERFDVNESSNSIEIGVRNEPARLRVELLVASLAIPRSATLISIVEPEKDFDHTLASLFNPIIGGVGIVYNYIGTAPPCTLGVNVRRTAVADTLFLTAGHCTPYPYQPGDNSLFWQPDFNGSVFGRVWSSPAPFTGQDCPIGEACRYADVLLGIHTTGSGRTKTLGSVARTTYSSATNGSVRVDHNSPAWTITQNALYPFQGELLSKVGRTTGWTEGFVISTGQRIRGAQGVVFLSQARVDAGADEGDSGAPVFGIIQAGNIRFMGILRGGVSGQSFSFSPYGNIQEDMGILSLN